ncbi:helix-turn-helix transcriptional regulator [Lentzea sp. BCCO 10_0061]|uniref:Helix-turn-helix transcriptional regulator n=1 Tax=Lentzea sokolovensis TaxID=3095429 RepID=A0ABU4VCD3_9PSEU|nr:helix-turn-helix transcriptional regulator [Lentzea sp. BCCO 10_0061]MDX8149027.1 helix-turn-helix transcriptional regulator [Lentzea sp. BCCO 10_0061]
MQHVEQVVEVTDLDAAHEVLNAAYGQMRLNAGIEHPHMRMSSRIHGDIRFDELHGHISLEVSVDPMLNYVFGHNGAGVVYYGSGGEDRFWLPGEVFLSAPPESSFVGAIADPRLSTVTLPQSVIDQVVDGARFTSFRPASPQVAAAWWSTCVHLRDVVLPNFEDNPLVAANAIGLLVSTTLAAFPNTTHAAPTSADRRDAHPRSLRRAVTFIEDNAATDISAADIARAARVSIRALQLAFRRYLGTTPMGYLRGVRLSCAHEDLRAGNGSVTEIAARWGYARPSVFAAHYRAAYDIPPSQTLRSR